MGLDMYLYRKTYVQNWDHFKPEQRTEITVNKMGENHPFIKPNRITYVVEQMGYWRKFNALHNWFIQNCGGGIDECQEIIVHKENFENLLKVLEKVREILNKSELTVKEVLDWNNQPYEEKIFDCVDEINDIFAPVSGFFFGSTDIDEYYEESVNETITIINQILIEDEVSCGYCDYYYRASW